MNKLILSDSKEFDVLGIYGGRKFSDGREREYLEIILPDNYSIDEINEAFNNEENTTTIKIEEFDGSEIANEFIHNNFCIYSELVKTKIITEKETDINPAVYTPVIKVTLCRLTYYELKQREQTELINATAEVLGDLIGGAN